MRSLVSFSLSAVALLLTTGQAAVAQTPFPQKPITLIVGAPPGGANDIVARTLAQKVKLGQPIVVLNRPGAGGQISSDQAAAAAPDGYTLFLGSTAVTVGPFLRKSFTPLNKLVPVVPLVQNSVVLSVDAKLPIKTIAELKAYGAANPGKLAIGSSGGQLDIISALLSEALGVKLKEVPFDGVAPVFTALLAGDVQMLFSSTTAARPFVEAGQIRTIANGNIKRDPLVPDLPTAAESGLPGFEVRTSWFGIMAPAGTPQPLIEQLNKAFNDVLKDEEAIARFKQLGMSVVGGTPQDLAEILKADVVAFERAAKVAKITPQ